MFVYVCTCVCICVCMYVCMYVCKAMQPLAVPSPTCLGRRMSTIRTMRSPVDWLKALCALLSSKTITSPVSEVKPCGECVYCGKKNSDERLF